jgi:hypothetical protein
MGKQELILPRGGSSLVESQKATVTVNVPAMPTSGFLESAVVRFRNNNSARATEARTRFTRSQVALTDAQTQLVEAEIKHQDALVRLQENPERVGHEVAMRRLSRAQSYRERQHDFEVTVLRQRNELTDIEAEYTHKKAALTHARTVLLDAEQQLEAQEQYGFFNYKLAHRKKAAEQLAIEMDEAERRALLKKHLRQMEMAEAPSVETHTEIDDALLARRDQLNAAGLNTDAIDRIIRERGNR